jgi:hypothetical protein
VKVKVKAASTTRYLFGSYIRCFDVRPSDEITWNHPNECVRQASSFLGMPLGLGDEVLALNSGALNS